MHHKRSFVDAITGDSGFLNVWVNPDRPVYEITAYASGKHQKAGGEFDVGLSDDACRALAEFISTVLGGTCERGSVEMASLSGGKCEIRIERQPSGVVCVDFDLHEPFAPDDDFIINRHVTAALYDDDLRWLYGVLAKND